MNWENESWDARIEKLILNNDLTQLELELTEHNVNGVSSKRPLLTAAHYGRLDGLRLILRRGASIHARTESGRTALMCAALGGHASVVQFLLNDGRILVDAVDNMGCTALFHAIEWSNDKEVVSMLLDCGANMNATKWSASMQCAPPWLHEIIRAREACRDIVLAVLSLRRRNARLLGGNGRDIVRLIGHYVWALRHRAEWDRDRPVHNFRFGE